MKKGLVSLLALATVLGGASSVSAESLKEALAAAYESNPQLMAQRAALRAVDENVSRAKSGFLPSLEGTYSRTEGEQNDLLETEPGSQGYKSFDNENLGLTVTQSLFRGFQDLNATKAAKYQVKAGRAQLMNIEQQVLLDAIRAYTNVVRDEAVVGLNKNQVQVLERQLQASRDRFRVGEITRTDVAQSEARLEGAKSNLMAAEARLAASRALYQRVVGRTPAGLEKENALPDLPATLDAAIEVAMAESPGVIAARHNERVASYNVKQSLGALSPRIGAQAGYTHRSGTSFFGGESRPSDTKSRSVSVQLTVPFYAGGARHSDVRRNKQLRSQRMVEIHQAERLAQESTFVAWDNLRAARGQIMSSEASVRANEIALEGVRQEAAVGSRTTLDVLNAEQELLNARSNLIGAQRDEMVAAYSLLSAIGRLTAKDLELGVTVYDPEEHYDDVKNQFFGLGIED
ncbi:type I secretion protein TolC [Kordiimonas sediminis]|uniref:Type I secretion protein TolC n=1 Tax=Kordiimonas sediminis TaxID=1735581 RepID=A0A919AVS3_9PROT|nr:TolC family outer membrane protein [Kordiimonas sediminis]GHF25882.1 type I secretion protein TolC [Kordiimonas sediminis]